MDPMSASNGAAFAFGALTDFPHNAGDADQYITSLDEHDRELLKKHEGEFQSREEVERFLNQAQ